MTAEIPTIATPRLMLRPLQLSDAGAVQILFPQWEIVQSMASHIPWPYPADRALTFIRDMALPAMQQGAKWHWPIRPKSAPEQLIGVVSLMDKPDNNRGFWLDLAWQGQGLIVGGKLSGHGLLVRDSWSDRPSCTKGRRECAISPHLRAYGNAGDQDRRARLRVGPLPYGSLGDYAGRVAQ
jgi:hypothetical protein